MDLSDLGQCLADDQPVEADESEPAEQDYQTIGAIDAVDALHAKTHFVAIRSLEVEVFWQIHPEDHQLAKLAETHFKPHLVNRETGLPERIGAQFGKVAMLEQRVVRRYDGDWHRTLKVRLRNPNNRLQVGIRRLIFRDLELTKRERRDVTKDLVQSTRNELHFA